MREIFKAITAWFESVGSYLVNESVPNLEQGCFSNDPVEYARKLDQSAALAEAERLQRIEK